MWGICLDAKTLEDGLFQTVVQYKIDHMDNKAVVISPRFNYKLDIEEIKELSAPPQYIYGEQVVPCNHPDVIGVIASIKWHFKLNCYFYTIMVNGKMKSKRYFDDDLISVPQI